MYPGMQQIQGTLQLYNFILQYFTFYSTKSYSSFCGATSQLACCRSSYLQDTEPDRTVSILIKGLERPWREKDITLHLWFNTRARKLYQINGVRGVYCWRTRSYDQTLWIRLIKVYLHIKFFPNEVSDHFYWNSNTQKKTKKKKQKKMKTHKVKYGCKRDTAASTWDVSNSAGEAPTYWTWLRAEPGSWWSCRSRCSCSRLRSAWWWCRTAGCWDGSLSGTQDTWLYSDKNI